MCNKQVPTKKIKLFWSHTIAKTLQFFFHVFHFHVIQLSSNCTRVYTNLENREKSGNFKGQGKTGKSQGIL
jgi:hypothetical protein